MQDNLVVHRHIDIPTFTICKNQCAGYFNKKATQVLRGYVPVYAKFTDNNTKIRFKRRIDVSEGKYRRISSNGWQTQLQLSTPVEMKKEYRQVFKMQFRASTNGDLVAIVTLVDISENYTITREPRN